VIVTRFEIAGVRGAWDGRSFQDLLPCCRRRANRCQWYDCEIRDCEIRDCEIRVAADSCHTRLRR
jgi:hypothetical protein